jgi:hypothetical protein
LQKRVIPGETHQRERRDAVRGLRLPLGRLRARHWNYARSALAAPGQFGATKTRARQRPIYLDDVVADVEFSIGIRKPEELLLNVAEDTLRDNFTKALTAHGITHRSLYQAKHTYDTRVRK